MAKLSLFSMPLALMVAWTPAADAATLYVDAALTTGADDGSSWNDAFQGPLGVQNALAAASSGDQIFVAQGTYLPTLTGSRTVSFALISGVELLGGFTGAEVVPEDRPPFGDAPTILSGDLAGDGSAVGSFNDNSFHVVTTTGTNATAVLEGFVVTGGAANGSGNNNRGGGILCVGAVSPTIRHCQFIENRSTFGGAAGYVNNGGAPTFTDCSFEDGVGGSFGGAFDIASGGAVLFERCLFRGNMAARGGALEIFATTGPIVSNCVFIDNTATGSSGGGGLWLGNGGNTRLRSCTIVGNTATNNAAGGVRVQGAGLVTVRNSIVWGNVGQPGTAEQDAQLTAGTNTAYSLIAGGVFAGPGNVTGDPLFKDLAGGDLTPTAGSPAVDSGANTASIPGVTLDFSSNDRFVDAVSVADTGVGPAPVIDIGALEFPDGPFVDLGHSLAGAGGAPVLEFSGTPEAGGTVNVSLSNAAPAATAFFIVGGTILDAPLFGGVLVPSPDIVSAFPTGTGALAFPVTWPAGIPSGIYIFTQVWIDDASGPLGFTASNAVQITVP